MDTDTKGDRTLDAAVVLGLLFILASAVFILGFVVVPESNRTLLAAILGTVVGSGLTSYINFRWGSSKGSQDKDATIAAIVQAPKDGQ